MVRDISKVNVNKEERPVLSVIVPVFKTEEYLSRCLDSILRQTFKQLEIIVVNDCSPGNAKEIVNYYIEKDSRIKYIEHDTNKGLFHARVSGSDIAKGDYLSFVDSDDYISIDYYRLLLDKALIEDADIVEGRIIREDENGYKFIQNNNNILIEKLTGEAIKEQFFTQEGLFYHWHVIWNKIYSKELWDKCLPYYKKQNKHLIMTEDLVFSSILFCNAKKYCSSQYDGYFYSIRPEASTGADADIGKFNKNFIDMGTAFDFVESFLKNVSMHEKFGVNLFNWKKRYFRLWANRLQATDMLPTVRIEALNNLKEALKINKMEPALAEDLFHSIINTPWEPKYEVLKNMIADESFEYISFDVFDTLVVRPFYDARDLLVILDDYFHQIYPSSPMLDFATIRLQAENRRRQLVGYVNPSWQDVNINEIYEQVMEEYNLPPEIVTKLKAKEIELELHFTTRRDSVYELYKMAIELNKKVLFVSDMYLPSSVIKEIVEKSGYVNYDKLYVSSETRLLKHTGDMYRYVMNDLEVEPRKILHIGDNWQSDKVMADEVGWSSFFVAKTLDLLLNRLSDKESGNSVHYLINYRKSGWTNNDYTENFGTRCMLATVANKLFDNPYISFNSDSDFNIDPYFIGYYALGMHTFGLCKWIMDDAMEKGYDTIHFMARDGYLPHQIYDVLTKHYPKAPKSNYFHASRRSLLPYLLTTNNKYSLDSFVSVPAHSPNSVMELFNDVLKEEIDVKSFEEHGILFSKNFSSEYEFKKFVDVLMLKGIDLDKLQKYVSKVEKYLRNTIKPNDATFDLGYSARLQTIINSVTGQRCNTYFVHTSKEVPWRLSRKNGFELKSYYDSKPGVSGILREHLFAELGPSCVSYEEKMNGLVEPLFEDYSSNSINDFIIQRIQHASIDFASDMMNSFRDYMSTLYMNNSDASLPLELYMHNSKQSDRSLLMHSYSDDTVHGGNNNNSILTWWNIETSSKQNEYINAPSVSIHNIAPTGMLLNRGRISKVIFYYLFDRDTLKKKVETRYKHKPILIKSLSMGYRVLRRIKRIFI